MCALFLILNRHSQYVVDEIIIGHLHFNVKKKLNEQDTHICNPLTPWNTFDGLQLHIYIYTRWHPKRSAGEHNKLDLKNAYTSKSTKYKLDLKNTYTSKSTKYKLDLKNAYTSKSTKQCKEQYNNYKQEAEDYFYVMETATNLGGAVGQMPTERVWHLCTHHKTNVAVYYVEESTCTHVTGSVSCLSDCQFPVGILSADHLHLSRCACLLFMSWWTSQKVDCLV